jgi:prepilin-type N-terminal cleavage/methylation domain-containing protein
MFSQIFDERGFTLVELLVALFISVVIGVATIGFMTYSHKSHAIQEQVADTQQNVRIGHDQLLRDVRLAGNGLDRGIAEPYDITFFEYGIYSVTGTWDDANTIDVLGDGSIIINKDGVGDDLPCGGSSTLQKPRTDAIAILRARGSGVRVLDRQPAGAVLRLDPADPDYPPNGFCGGTSNCGGPGNGPILFCKAPGRKSIRVQLTNQSGTPGQYVDNSGLGLINPPGGIDAISLQNGTCHRADRLVYYVNQKCQLVVSTNNQAPVVLANEVEDMQIAYFVDTGLAQIWRGTGNAPDPSLSADDPDIRLVRINLVARTAPVAGAGLDPLFTSSPQAAVAPAASLENHGLSAVPDNYRRRLLTSVVSVRNNVSE